MIRGSHCLTRKSVLTLSRNIFIIGNDTYILHYISYYENNGFRWVCPSWFVTLSVDIFRKVLEVPPGVPYQFVTPPFHIGLVYSTVWKFQSLNERNTKIRRLTEIKKFGHKKEFVQSWLQLNIFCVVDLIIVMEYFSS